MYFISFELVFCLPSNVCIEGIRSPENEVTDSCGLSGRYWESELGPLEEQPVLLNTESSLRPKQHDSLKEVYYVGLVRDGSGD